MRRYAGVREERSKDSQPPTDQPRSDLAVLAAGIAHECRALAAVASARVQLAERRVSTGIAEADGTDRDLLAARRAMAAAAEFSEMIVQLYLGSDEPAADGVAEIQSAVELAGCGEFDIQQAITLPAMAAPVGLVRHAVRNLLDNAKAAGEPTPSVTVERSTWNGRSAATIAVTGGSGFSESRFDEATDPTTASRVGLSMTRAMLRAVGGELRWIGNDPVRLAVVLPFADADAEAQHAA
ncbi:MAG: hypothetical protein AAF747_01650 [Planctomycetota bacterium]